MTDETDPKAQENEQNSHSLVPTKAKEIGQSLKEKVKSVGKKRLTADFENTMAEIENESDYRMQEKRLTAYKKLLEQQMDVIDSRLKMVKRI
jgi:molecular chaperone GrpE (heat shock protein)